MLRFCENTYRFIGILCVLKQGVALGTKVVVRSDVAVPCSSISISEIGWMSFTIGGRGDS
jgi:hypothetical protein